MSPRRHRRAREPTIVMDHGLGLYAKCRSRLGMATYADIQVNFASSGPKAGGGIRRFEAAS